MSFYCLQYLFDRYYNEDLSYDNWPDKEKRDKYSPSLNISEDDLTLFDSDLPSWLVFSKLYFEDDDLLFLFIYLQLKQGYIDEMEFFEYNGALEDPDFEYDPSFHEHIYLADVKVYLVRTKNKVYIFGLCSSPEYQFAEVISWSNINSHIAIDTFDRLGIKNNRNFQTLVEIIESHYKRLLEPN